jgi:hypothetical protein
MGLKMKLETTLFASISVKGWCIGEFKSGTEQEVEKLADLTISLKGQLLVLAGVSYIKQCRLRIGKLNLLLVQPTCSGPTSADIGSAIEKMLKQSFVKGFKEFLLGFRRLTMSSYLLIGTGVSSRLSLSRWNHFILSKSKPWNVHACRASS